METRAAPRTRTRDAATTSRRGGRVAGGIAASILVRAAAVHAYWALGGQWAAQPPTARPTCRHAAWSRSWTVLILAAAALLLARTSAAGNFAAPAESYAREWHVFFFGPLLLGVSLLCAVAVRSSPQPR